MDEDRIMAILRSNPHRAYHLNELLRLAGSSPKKEKIAKRLLKSMTRRGLIERRRGRTYTLSRAGQSIEGSVRIDNKGLFVVAPNASREAPVPIIPDETQGLRVGDLVRGELVAVGRRGRLYFHVLEILRRDQTRHVGKFRQVGQALFVEVELVRTNGMRPDLTNVPIPKGRTKDAQNGELVEVKVQYHSLEGRSAPLGEVVQVLGKPGERSTELQKLLIEHNLDQPFPEAAVAEAEAFGDVPTEEDKTGRRDARELPLVTIDGETAKDFDDAVCAIKDKSGFKLYVAVADVSHYVRMGTPLDDEAQSRGTSTYLTDRAIPMLPEKLSNGLCSLNPKVDRLCMLAEMDVLPNGRITGARFQRAIMRSKARLTYTRVQRALEGEPDKECQALMPTLLLLSRISAKLFERRIRRGAIDLDLPEAQVVLSDDGEVLDAVRRPRQDAHRVIEELMLATNEAVASYFVQRELPTLFRVHDAPDPDKLEVFAQLCAQLGVELKLGEEPEPAEVAHLLEALAELEAGRALHWLLLRSLKQARYEAECRGHYGLASKAYLHFTSPIRRYPDLVVHRLLKRSLDGDSSAYTQGVLERLAESCSQLEREAMTAERNSLELDRAFVAKKHLGERFEGTITGLQSFGLFVQLDAPFIEGMIPVYSLPEDYYEVEEHNATLTGRNTGRVFMLGDRVEVEIASVSIARRKVELRLSDSPDRSDRSDRPDRSRRKEGAPRRRPIAAKPARRGGKPSKPHGRRKKPRKSRKGPRRR